jgi:type I restriction enzyme S subunit
LALKSTHTVSEVADVQVGIVIKPTRYYADGVEGTKAFRSLNVGTMCVNDADWVYFSDDAMKETQRTVARTGDVLIVRSGNPGTSCVVTPEYDGCNVIDLIIAHPIKDKILPEYLCAFTNYPHGMNQIIGQQRGVAQKHFNVGLYNQMKIILPTLEEQRRFVAILKQTDKSKFVAYQETIFIEKILKYTYNHTFRRKNNVH